MSWVIGTNSGTIGFNSSIFIHGNTTVTQPLLFGEFSSLNYLEPSFDSTRFSFVINLNLYLTLVC